MKFHWKRNIFIIIGLFTFSIILLVIIVAASPLRVDNVVINNHIPNSQTDTVQSNDNLNNGSSPIQYGDSLELLAHYTATLKGFRPHIIWRMKDRSNRTSEVEGTKTLSLVVDGYQSVSVECQVTYRLFNRIVRRSDWHAWSIDLQDSRDYILYQDSVVNVPPACILATSAPQSTVTIDISSANCTSIRNITIGTILLSTSASLQNKVLKYYYSNANLSAIIVTINSTYAEPLDVIGYASFTNYSIAPPMTVNVTYVDSSSNTIQNSYNDQQQQIQQIQDNQPYKEKIIKYSFDTGNRLFNPSPSVAIAFNAKGSVTLNPTITLKIGNGNLKYYSVEWSPDLQLELLGSIVLNLQADISPTFTLWNATLDSKKLFGLIKLFTPTFSFPMSFNLQCDTLLSTDLIANIHAQGGYRVDFDPATQVWSNPTVEEIKFIRKDVQFIPQSPPTHCNALIQVEFGVAVGVKFLSALSVSLKRSVQFGWKYVTPAPTLGRYDQPGMPPNLDSNALCSGNRCYCNCEPGAPLGSFKGAYINIGWTLDISLSIFKIINKNFLDRRFLDYNEYVGPQTCIARKSGCASINPTRCPQAICPASARLCTYATDCYACPQPGLASCGSPSELTSAQYLWCAQTYNNGGIPLSKPPSCPYSLSCTVRCCGGSDWSTCYFSANTYC